MLYSSSRIFKWRQPNANLYVKGILKLMNIEKRPMTIEFIDTGRMRYLNHKYRGYNKTTDVLSFSMSSSVIDDGCPLGEIYICPQYVQRWLRNTNSIWKVDLRLRRLIVHGICHLLGHDHETMDQFRKMFSLECRLLNFSAKGGSKGLLFNRNKR